MAEEQQEKAMAPESNPEPQDWADFLTHAPAGTSARVKGAISRYSWKEDEVEFPDLLLHCSSDRCSGVRTFRRFSLTPSSRDCKVADGHRFVSYKCRNCEETTKTYAVMMAKAPTKDGGDSDGFDVAYKYGEVLPLHLTVPSRVNKLIGEDREFFFKGKKCEADGLGIAAFAYYRRVVENQKDRLFDQIIEASRRVGMSADKIEGLEHSKTETQFSKAHSDAKRFLPESLLIGGHSPLLLLHRALSDGLHARTDAECLELARTIRLVLSDLAERLDAVLKDQRELSDAVTRLMQPPEQRLLTDRSTD